VGGGLRISSARARPRVPLHGNVFDVVPAGGRLFSLKDFLEE
jgi:hypothetical protein